MGDLGQVEVVCSVVSENKVILIVPARLLLQPSLSSLYVGIGPGLRSHTSISAWSSLQVRAVSEILLSDYLLSQTRLC